jgi:exosortase
MSIKLREGIGTLRFAWPIAVFSQRWLGVCQQKEILPLAKATNHRPPGKRQPEIDSVAEPSLGVSLLEKALATGKPGLTEFFVRHTIRESNYIAMIRSEGNGMPMPQSAAIQNKLNLTTSAWPARMCLFVLAIVLGWSFWPTFAELCQKWLHDPQYSHGLLVPGFALYLLWTRRDMLTAVGPPQVAAGLSCLALAVACRIVSGIFCFEWIDAVALLPCLAGIALLLGGKPALKCAWPAIAFLYFMIPMPYRVETALSAPLQRLATLGSAFLLKSLGQPAIAEGNTIMMNEIKLGVVEACSGLRMLVTFFTFSTGVAIIIRKPWLEKMCIVLSAIPIALITNILRITVTGLMYQSNRQFAQMFFHDLAGWFMMPVCLIFLGVELWILNRLILQDSVPRARLRLA